MRPSTRRWLWLLAAGALLASAAWASGPLNARRQRDRLVMPSMPKTVRPSMLLTPLLALGRAPIVDYLWIRATTLKEEGRYFDAYQLSEMICELEPKFAVVWAFQGWNMSYNISVTQKTPEERWRWVKNGYELIRDKGIPLNPNNTQLYRELAWIFYHKIGDYLDEWHAYYKLQLALQMEDILGPPPEGFVSEGVVAGDYYRNYPYAGLAAAPQTVGELLALPHVRPFADKLAAFGFDVGVNGVFLGLLASLRENTVQIPHAKPGEREDRLHALRALMTDPATAEVRRSLERFWRAWRLRHEVRLDPARIVELQQAYGVTLDFRVAESQALYWANLGMEMGVRQRTNVDIHRLNTNRIEFFCLQKMFHRGRLSMSQNAKLGEPPLFNPDLRFAPILFEAYQRDSKEYLSLEYEKKPVSEDFSSGFVSFLRTVILRYSERNMRKEAQEYFDFLKEHFPDPMYKGGLDGFLTLQFREDRKNTDYRVAIARINSLISRGLVLYAFNDDEEAVLCLRRAREISQGYQADVVSKRMELPRKFPELIEEVAHELGGRMNRASYEAICKKLNIPPKPPSPGATSRPAES